MPRRTPSPITVACLVLATVVLCAGTYIVSRPGTRHESAAPTARQPPLSSPTAPLVASQDRDRSPTSALGVDIPALASPPQSQPDRGATHDGPPEAKASATIDDKTAIKNRQLLIAAHELQVIQQADEQVFDDLKVPEPTRVLIRKIDEAYGNRTRESLSVDDQGLSIDRQVGREGAVKDEAERARRAAIQGILGAEGARDFSTAEYAEVRRLRIRYRRQWAEELDENAPRPPGMPRSPH